LGGLDLQVTAHFGQKARPDFLLPIFEGREFVTEIKTAVTALAFIAYEYTVELSGLSQAPDRFILGHMCPSVKLCRRFSTGGRRLRRMRAGMPVTIESILKGAAT
jgi:hypothetical protein